MIKGLGLSYEPVTVDDDGLQVMSDRPNLYQVIAKQTPSSWSHEVEKWSRRRRDVVLSTLLHIQMLNRHSKKI